MKDQFYFYLLFKSNNTLNIYIYIYKDDKTFCTIIRTFKHIKRNAKKFKRTAKKGKKCFVIHINEAHLTFATYYFL